MLNYSAGIKQTGKLITVMNAVNLKAGRRLTWDKNCASWLPWFCIL